jgi:hypothetical protein
MRANRLSNQTRYEMDQAFFLKGSTARTARRRQVPCAEDESTLAEEPWTSQKKLVLADAGRCRHCASRTALCSTFEYSESYHESS